LETVQDRMSLSIGTRLVTFWSWLHQTGCS